MPRRIVAPLQGAEIRAASRGVASLYPGLTADAPLGLDTRRTATGNQSEIRLERLPPGGVAALYCGLTSDAPLGLDTRRTATGNHPEMRLERYPPGVSLRSTPG